MDFRDHESIIMNLLKQRRYLLIMFMGLASLTNGQVVSEQNKLYKQLNVATVELETVLIDSVQLPDYFMLKRVQQLNKAGRVSGRQSMNHKGDTLNQHYYSYDRDSIVKSERAILNTPNSGYFREYFYDEKQRIKQENKYQYGELYTSTKFSYNRKGLLTKKKREMPNNQKTRYYDDFSLISIKYDKLGRVIKRKEVTIRDGVKRWTKSESIYTDLGYSRKVYKSESQSQERWLQAEYIFDRQNRLSEVINFTKAKSNIYGIAWEPDDRYRIEVSYSDDGLALEEKLYLNEEKIAVKKYRYQYRRHK